MAQASYNKYGNIKTIVDGITFDSKVEAQYYGYLKNERKFGRIKNFWVHQAFVLTEAYQLEGQKRKNAAIKYYADFVVQTNENKMKVIDVKGGDTTAEFKLKKKKFESKYHHRLIEVRWKTDKWVES